MRNAKEEILKEVNISDILCAEIRCKGNTILLEKGGDVLQFLNSLNFEYDAGYGGQELYGTVWLKDGKTWLERGEYDGAEWWNIKKLPNIPKKLKGGD